MNEFRDGRPVPGWLSALDEQAAEREPRQWRQMPQPGSEMTTNPSVAAQIAADRERERQAQAQAEREMAPGGWLGRTVAASDARTALYREEREERIAAYEERRRRAAVALLDITVDDLTPDAA